MSKKSLLVLSLCLLLVVGLVSFFVPDASAALDVPSLLTAADFTTPTADAKTAATGVLTIFFIIMVVGIIMAVLRH